MALRAIGQAFKPAPTTRLIRNLRGRGGSPGGSPPFFGDHIVAVERPGHDGPVDYWFRRADVSPRTSAPRNGPRPLRAGATDACRGWSDRRRYSIPTIDAVRCNRSIGRLTAISFVTRTL